MKAIGPVLLQLQPVTGGARLIIINHFPTKRTQPFLQSHQNSILSIPRQASAFNPLLPGGEGGGGLGTATPVGTCTLQR